MVSRLRNVIFMLSGRKRDWSVLIGAVALTRFLFRSHYLYDIDSVNFALAMRRFDPSVHQPHPPGYFLYVYLGRLVNVLFHDPNAALVAISIAASCAAALTIYALTDEWFGTQAARFAGLLFLFSPLAWFHGTVALTYIVEAFFSALVGLICWRIYSRPCSETRARWMLVGAFVLGVAAGVRPSSLLFLGPLFLFSLKGASAKQAFVALALLAATVLAWLIPMIYASGGPAAYFGSLSLLWRMVPGRQDVANSFFFVALARLLLIASILILCFGSAMLLFFRVLCDSKPSGEREKKLFTCVWIGPGLLFFTFVFLTLVNSGYLLVVFPPICAWLGHWAWEWYAGARLPRSLKTAAVMLAAAVNAAIFLYAPVYCSYRRVRQFEAELEKVQQVLPRTAPPGQTLIIGLDSHFLGFRHAGYYFPDYRIAEFPEFRSPVGMRVFTMQGRDTHLVDRLAANDLANFVLFPLPERGSEYRKAEDKFRAKFPAKDLHTANIAGCEFITGPIADLPLLFPTTSERPVYTAHDFRGGAVYRR